MVKWSLAVSLAFHSMALLADKEGETVTVESMGKTLKVSTDHLSKVLQRLGKSDLVKSVRGPQGGYSFVSDPANISLLDIYECIEGRYTCSECMLHIDGCGSERCIFGDIVGHVNRILADYLSKTTLSDVVSGKSARLSGPLVGLSFSGMSDTGPDTGLKVHAENRREIARTPSLPNVPNNASPPA
ncbi:MAG: Rrf2 family transcriptional regulator [Kiritimatiellia bacterium]|jgi:Rrf2 family protein|nr:Rrf2 family transcriptional regulator [Kiritimatiellia bacterium]